ncbi:MAG: [FeFe] hydrogenase H-cluster radical SAM maturase HydE [Spirochaetes bacterium]|nr:[FeFe] hydrogenase H-cluster radical SAM maturase HydE [Spirochaetota bacterium]
MKCLKDIINFYKNTSTDDLAKTADNICTINYGKNIFIRGLLEFSNYCNMNCLYCGIRKDNKKVNRYRMSIEDIIKTVKKGYQSGIKTFVLQSGEDHYYTIEKLCLIIKKIKESTNFNAAVTLSCGIKTRKQYLELKKAGCDRYLLRFETSDEKLHKYLRNGVTLKKRINAIMDLKDLGFETGSGYMVGLPGENETTRINNALLCKKLELDMVGIGPFIPHNDTPLKESIQENIELVVRATSLVRLLLPYANIPATTASGTLDKIGREKMLKAGANVLMPNINDEKYKKNYLLYPGKICIEESGSQCLSCLNKRVSDISKNIVMDRGDSLSFLNKNKSLVKEKI